ncbi:MAG: hypothetical protein LC751_10500 [Actinobacteria bacterium]|nr:hypothetical protein [Actinomycetota bacterium]
MAWKARLLVLATAVAMLMSIAGTAMADDFTRCRDLNGDFVRCNGDLFEQVDNNFGFNNFNDCNDGLFNDCNDGLFFDSCPFAGDTKGLVNELDCLD